MLKNLPAPLFSFSGRVTRFEYFITLLVVTGISIFYVLTVHLLFSKEALTSGIGYGIFMTWILVLIPFGISLVVRRLRDTGMSLWWMLILPSHILSLYVKFCLFFKRGKISNAVS